MARTRRWPSLTIGRLGLSSSCGRGQSPSRRRRDVSLRCATFASWLQRRKRGESRARKTPLLAVASPMLMEVRLALRPTRTQGRPPLQARYRPRLALYGDMWGRMRLAPSPISHVPPTRGQAMDVREVQILMPLPCEQANFALERVNALSGLVGGGRISSSRGSSGGSQVPASSVNRRVAWSKVAEGGAGTTVKAANLDAMRLHAAIKLLGAGAEELGQGVFAIAPPWCKGPPLHPLQSQAGTEGHGGTGANADATPPAAEERATLVHYGMDGGSHGAAAASLGAGIVWAVDAQPRPFSLQMSVQGRLAGTLHGVCSASWKNGR